MKNFLLFLFLLACGICSGQNLVPNPSFEQHSGCPVGYDDLDSALYWFNPTVGGNNGSPDYFNICCPTYDLSVPDNYYGHQPANNGVAYCGIVLYIPATQNAREYIEVQLTSVLDSNTCYHFQMNVNLANICRYTTYDIQVYFSDTSIKGIPNFYPLPFTPQISNAMGNTFDTLNWTSVSGDYTALGGESYLIIGNFKDDTATNSTMVNNIGELYAYCYLDDVSLTPCETTGIDKLSDFAKENISPNPFSSQLVFSLSTNEQTTITLYDIFSRQVLQQIFSNSATLNTAPLQDGIYFYELRNEKGIVKNGKVVKQ